MSFPEADPALLIQALVLAIPAAWLTIGVLDNILYPSVNRDEVAGVMALEVLKNEPGILEKVGHRAVTSRQAVGVVFALIIIAELCATGLMWAGAFCLVLSWLGYMTSAGAGAVAMSGAVAFTGIWGGFLIGGQWFYYWHGQYGQATHLLAILWGLGTLLVVML